MGAIGNDRVGVRREFLAHVARTVEETVASTEGSVLVFLPGVGEIEAVRRALSLPGVDVLTLHGQLSAAEQDRALTPASGRRVILSTSIAESSLTVPGVSVVVDAGLAREPRFDAGRSLSSPGDGPRLARAPGAACGPRRAHRPGRRRARHGFGGRGAQARAVRAGHRHAGPDGRAPPGRRLGHAGGGARPA